jgi:hypothetical protein
MYKFNSKRSTSPEHLRQVTELERETINSGRKEDRKGKVVAEYITS